VYKQWHPAVSVLFADISSYTAMSQQVEPEQVGS
jgi:class 3 adenylate cyclase